MSTAASVTHASPCDPPVLEPCRTSATSWRVCGRENARLRKLLKLTDAEAAPARGTQAAWFDKAPGPVDASVVAAGEGRVLRRPVRRTQGRLRDPLGERPHREVGLDARGRGRLAQGRTAADQRHLPLTPEVLAAHLTGDVHIGLYPMLPGDQTCWLAADFDGQAAMLDALAYLKAARAVGAPAALEVSRSGSAPTCGSSSPTPCPRPPRASSAPDSSARRSRSAAGWTFAATTGSSRPKTCCPGRAPAT